MDYVLHTLLSDSLKCSQLVHTSASISQGHFSSLCVEHNPGTQGESNKAWV